MYNSATWTKCAFSFPLKMFGKDFVQMAMLQKHANSRITVVAMQIRNFHNLYITIPLYSATLEKVKKHEKSNKWLATNGF